MSVVQRGVRSRELPPPQLTLFSRDRATIDERTMLVERGNSPMFYVTINPTVNSTAKDYKRSFNRSKGIILCLS